MEQGRGEHRIGLALDERVPEVLEAARAAPTAITGMPTDSETARVSSRS